jgi:hypothetical protein
MLRSASVPLRAIYCLSLAIMFYPIAIVILGRIGFSHGESPWGTILPLIWVAFIALGAWRIFQVVTRAETLDSYVYTGIVKVLRVVGISVMVLSIVNLIVQVGFGAYMSLDPKPDNLSMDTYVTGLYIALLGGLTPLGLWTFEISRLFGFERNSRGEN